MHYILHAEPVSGLQQKKKKKLAFSSYRTYISVKKDNKLISICIIKYHAEISAMKKKSRLREKRVMDEREEKLRVIEYSGKVFNKQVIFDQRPK